MRSAGCYKIVGTFYQFVYNFRIIGNVVIPWIFLESISNTYFVNSVKAFNL